MLSFILELLEITDAVGNRLHFVRHRDPHLFTR